MRRYVAFAAFAVVLTALLAACSTSAPVAGADGVRRAGQHVRVYEGDQLLAALGFRHAAGNTGSEWLLLDLALSTPGGAATTVKRGDLSVVSPAGARIALAEQADIAAGWSDLRGQVRRASVASDPLDYFTGREACSIQFFTEPTAGIAFNEVTVNHRRTCQGRLFFHVPGGVQPGQWSLRIELEEEEVEIPFLIPR